MDTTGWVVLAGVVALSLLSLDRRLEGFIDRAADRIVELENAVRHLSRRVVELEDLAEKVKRDG